MVRVLQMRRTPRGRIDLDALSRLEKALGTRRSREVIEDACFEIIERLTSFEVAHASLDGPEARRLARAVAAISAEMGMPDLSEAARAAAECQGRADPVARAATAIRLLRAGEASLDAVLGAPKGNLV